MDKNMMTFHDILGTVGVIITLLAYLLLNLRRLSSDNHYFALMNAVGSLLILESLIYHWNISSFFMECAWLIISIYGIYSTKRREV